MNKIVSPLLVVVLALSLSGCMAVQTAAPNATMVGDQIIMHTLGFMETWNGIKGTILETIPCSFILERGGYFALAWPRGLSWGMALLSKDGSTVARSILSAGLGQDIDTMSFSQLVKALLESGWKQITPSELPANIVNAMGSRTAPYLQLLKSFSPTILIAPLGAFQDPLGILEPYEQVNE